MAYMFLSTDMPMFLVKYVYRLFVFICQSVRKAQLVSGWDL
jgi:hypothetical protein